MKENLNNKNTNEFENKKRSINKKKHILYILAIFLFILSIYFISDSYSKYKSNADSKLNAKVAKWNIIVNNKNITANESLQNQLTPILPGTKHIKPGILAPTAKGYFDLDLNLEDVDVSFKYLISVKENLDNKVLDLKITGFSENGGPIQNISETNTVEQIVNLDDQERNKTIRVFFEWIDSKNEKMNNIEDTKLTTEPNSQGVLDVNLQFIQVTD